MVIMFIRFTTEFKNEYDEIETGVFRAAAYIQQRNIAVYDYDKKQINEIINWFNQYLNAPTRFSNANRKNAANVSLSWFKSTATLHPVSYTHLDVYKRQLQQDSAYGEFLIFQDGYPKFLFSAFNNNGEEKRIVLSARKLNIHLGDFIIKLLIDNGYKNVHYLKKSFFYYACLLYTSRCV